MILVMSLEIRSRDILLVFRLLSRGSLGRMVFLVLGVRLGLLLLKRIWYCRFVRVLFGWDDGETIYSLVSN